MVNLNIKDHNSPQENGNILGIEPDMLPQDYESQESLRAKLDSYLAAAREQRFLNEQTIVLWPEWIGSPLLVAGEAKSIYQARSIAVAIGLLILSHLSSFVHYWLTAKEKNKVIAAIFRMKAQSMAQNYDAVFSGLARDYAVTMVAGSIVLPAPQIQDGKLVPGEFQ